MKTLAKYFVFGDQRLFYILNKNISCKILDKLMPMVTELGGGIFASVLPLLLIIIGKSNIRLMGIKILLSLSLSQLFVQILKRSLTRQRPYNILQNINTFGIVLKDYSFPSGHTTASFSIATAIWLSTPYLMIPLMFVALMVGVSRIYLAVHYPSDVLVGMILGITSSVLTHSYFINYFI